VPPERKRDVLADRNRVEERGILEQEPIRCRTRPSAAPFNPVISSSSTKMRPESGCSNPMMCFNVTLFPVPLRPRMQKAWPGATANETSRSTGRESNALLT
jgi:hypothetical protein